MNFWGFMAGYVPYTLLQDIKPHIDYDLLNIQDYIFFARVTCQDKSGRRFTRSHHVVAAIPKFCTLCRCIEKACPCIRVSGEYRNHNIRKRVAA
jgi:hypothetical protein